MNRNPPVDVHMRSTTTSLHEKKTGWHQWTLFLIFCVDVHMGLDPPSPVHMRPPEPNPPSCGRHKWMAPNNHAQVADKKADKTNRY